MKNEVRKLLSIFGYEIRKTNGSAVQFENFSSLVDAYEQHLNASGIVIPPNAMRPKLLARLMGTPPSEAYFIIRALADCRSIPGDVCEFGVAQGETSALIANEISLTTNKCLHLF